MSEWISQGFITKAQKEKIENFETKRSKKSRLNWVLYGFLILGGVVLGIGFISIIAANWEYIPASIKLVTDFLIIVILALIIFKADEKKKDILFDAVSIIFIMLILASIGLISQIYHTGGHPYQALLFWLIIILPISILGKKGFMPHLWVAGFLTMFLVWAFSNSSWWHFIASRDDDYFTIILIFPLLCMTLGNLLAKIEHLKINRFGKNFNLWAAISGFCAIFATDIYYSFSEFTCKNTTFYPVWIFSTLALIFLFLRKDIKQKEKLILTIFLGFFIVIYFIPKLIFPESNFDEFGIVFAPFVSIILLALLAIYYSIRDNKRMFNLITLLIGSRFIIVYFQVIGDLATTGLGLIVSGLFIIGITLLWYKNHEKLETWIGEIIK